MDNYIRIKKSLEKLNSFSDQQVVLFYNMLSIKQLDKKSLLLKSGHVCNFIVLIFKGTLRMHTAHEEIERTVSFFTEDEWVADFSSFVSQKPSLNAIIAMEKTEVAIISIFNLHQLIAIDPAFMVLGRLLDKWTAPIHNKSPEIRYKELLQNHPEWIIRFPQKHLASYLGMAPETFSRMKRKTLFS